MKKRAYNRVDTSKFTRKQKAAYNKRLAAVRKYTQVKRQWEKDIKLGKIPPTMTLAEYRGEKPSDTVAHMRMRSKFFKKQNIDVSKMERLINELQRAVQKEKEREETQKRIAGLLEEIEELNVA